MQQRQGVREMRLVFEADSPFFNQMDNRIMDRVTAALAGINHLHAAVAFFDEKGTRLRKTELTKGSDAMAKLIEVELAEDEAVGA